MNAVTEAAHRFYQALAHGDRMALFELLTDDFEGLVSAGMPHGVGGRHHGRVAMISDVWARIASVYDMHVEPAQYLCVVGADEAGTSEDVGERVVVVGTYRGRARDGDTSVDASFAHVITVRNGRITALQQITDTVRWHLPA